MGVAGGIGRGKELGVDLIKILYSCMKFSTKFEKNKKNKKCSCDLLQLL